MVFPATLLVARHGDADYDHPHVLSDDGGWLTEVGREQVTALARSLVDRSVAAVYASTMQRAVESAELAARVLGVGVSTSDGLREFAVGELAGRRYDDPALAEVYRAWNAGDLDTWIPGGESGAHVVQRYRTALQAIADGHRGQTVLAFSHGGVMSFALPRLGARVRDDLVLRSFLPNCATAEVTAGDEGFDVIAWPGSSDRSVV